MTYIHSQRSLWTALRSREWLLNTVCSWRDSKSTLRWVLVLYNIFKSTIFLHTLHHKPYYLVLWFLYSLVWWQTSRGNHSWECSLSALCRLRRWLHIYRLLCDNWSDNWSDYNYTHNCVTLSIIDNYIQWPPTTTECTYNHVHCIINTKQWQGNSNETTTI